MIRAGPLALLICCQAYLYNALYFLGFLAGLRDTSHDL